MLPEPEAPIRVLIADDHAMFRAGLNAILTVDDIEVVAEAGTAEEAIAAASAFLPDVAVLDITMPGDGMHAAAVIQEQHPSIRILMLTASDDGADLYASLKAGAHGYLLKNFASEQISQAVTAVAHGESLIDPTLAGLLLTEFKSYVGQQERASHDVNPRLSPRELEILRLIARGMGNRDIGRKLYISENTVKNHVRNVMEKLHVHTRLNAVIAASRLDLIDLETEAALS